MSKETEQIARIQKGLHCSLEDARKIYAYDCEVDHSNGGLEHDLSAAQNKVAQAYVKTGTRKSHKETGAYNLTKRERKPNATKGAIIDDFSRFLKENASFAAQNVQILNPERQISFEVGGEKYEMGQKTSFSRSFRRISLGL